MDTYLAGVVVHASGVSARPAAPALEVYERAVTLRAIGGEVCLPAGASVAPAWPGSAVSARIGSGLTQAGTAGQRSQAQSPVQTQNPIQTKSTFAAFMGMDDIQVGKPRTGYRVPRGTG
jgi:hypothetical protein